MASRLALPRPVRAAAVLAVVPGFVLIACSSSGPSQASAKQQVCTARTNVQTSFQKVTDDLKSLNFGQAKTDAAGVKTALNDLVSARSNLNDATKAKIAPDITALQSSLAAVQSASTLTEAAGALSSAKAAVQSALQSISDAVGCS